MLLLNYWNATELTADAKARIFIHTAYILRIASQTLTVIKSTDKILKCKRVIFIFLFTISITSFNLDEYQGDLIAMSEKKTTENTRMEEGQRGSDKQKPHAITCFRQ